MKLPTITPRQQDIVRLVYAYRFLDRAQIQTALGHKDKSKIQIWLNDLRAKGYIERIYDGTSLVEKNKLAIYYLGTKGVGYLRSLDAYPLDELRKRYKDSSRSQSFIERSVLVASCYLMLADANKLQAGVATSNTPNVVTYEWFPEADYIDPEHAYHFLAEHETLRPNLCIVKRNKQGSVIANYLLEIFDASLPRYRMRYRLKKYVTYLDDQEWEADELQPIILLVCSSTTELIYAKRATKKLIEDTYADEGELNIRFTTAEKLKSSGITAAIWEEGRRLYGV